MVLAPALALVWPMVLAHGPHGPSPGPWRWPGPGPGAIGQAVGRGRWPGPGSWPGPIGLDHGPGPLGLAQIQMGLGLAQTELGLGLALCTGPSGPCGPCPGPHQAQMQSFGQGLKNMKYRAEPNIVLGRIWVVVCPVDKIP